MRETLLTQLTSLEEQFCHMISTKMKIWKEHLMAGFFVLSWDQSDLKEQPERAVGDGRFDLLLHDQQDVVEYTDRIIVNMGLTWHFVSQGGGDMIVTPNGVRMNGLVKTNGHLPNGHVTPAHLDLSATSEVSRRAS